MGGVEQTCRSIGVTAGAVLVKLLDCHSSGCNHGRSSQEWLEQLGNYFSHKRRLPQARKGLVLWLSDGIKDPGSFVLLFHPLHVADCLML